MIKKLICLVLSLALFVALCIPALAADNSISSSSPNFASFRTSNTGRMEIEIIPQDSTKIADNETSSFTITQYENEEIVQTVSGKPNGSTLIVTDYQNGIATKESVINVSDRIIKSQTASSDVALNRASVGTPIGYISYNKDMVTGENLRIRVYSLLTKHDVESYTINGKKSDTLAVITGLVGNIVAVFIPDLATWKEIAIAIVSTFGGSILGDAIDVIFSEQVAVDASYYELTGYDYTLDRYTRSQGGVARRVLTKNSNAYDKWFYDWFTPRNWKDNTLAYWFWSDLNSGDHYPGVKSYS